MSVDSLDESLLTEKNRVKSAKILIWACFFMYVLMMGSKNVFTAELVTLQGVFGTSKAETSLAMTYYFITYAAGQIILSSFMGKINLRVYLIVTGGLSAIITVLLGLINKIEIAYVLCGVNGVFQAGIFSGCMALLSKYLPVKMLPFANTIMTIGTAIWGVISYGLPVFFVGQGLWNAPFIILGALFFISVIFFAYAAIRMKKFTPAFIADRAEDVPQKPIDEKPFVELKTKSNKVIFWVLAILESFIMNIPYYIVNSWIPDMMNAVFNMSEEYSILITLLVPLVSGICSILVINLCEKSKNLVNVALLFTIISLLTVLPMTFIFKFNIIISISLLTISIAFCTGAKNVFLSVMAFKMRTQVDSGSYLAAMNGVGAVIAGVVPPIAGEFIDSFNGISGYGNSYLLAAGITLLGAIVMIVFNLKFKSNKKGFDANSN